MYDIHASHSIGSHHTKPLVSIPQKEALAKPNTSKTLTQIPPTHMTLKNILSYLFGLILLASAVAHLLYPDFYAPMIPDFIPEGFANLATAIVEAGIGVLLFLPNYRHWGGLGFCVLMIAFLPLHVWDMLKETPAVGPSPAAEIRLVIQFLLIYAGGWIYKKAKP